MTKIKIAILDKLSEECPELNAVLDKLIVIKREFPGAGCFTHFQKLEKSLKNYPAFKWLYLNIVIQIPELQSGLGSFLDVSEGSPDILELYIFGDESCSDEHSEFQIKWKSQHLTISLSSRVFLWYFVFEDF